MMQDKRMRDAGRGGALLQPQPLRPTAGDQLLRGVEDQPPRLFRRAPEPFSRGRHQRPKIYIDIIVNILYLDPIAPTSGTIAMSSPTDTRLHPIAAYRAVRKLMQNREDTRQVFLLIDALRGKTTLRQLARFRQTEFGQRPLAERRRLFDRLEDWETLKALPAGTLGRAYYEFMASENLSAAGLAKVSTIPQSSDDSIWFRERNRGDWGFRRHHGRLPSCDSDAGLKPRLRYEARAARGIPRRRLRRQAR